MNVLQPKLRFPEFEGEWKNKLLDDISVRGSGHTPNKKFENYYNGDIKWVSLADSKNLDNGYIAKTMYEISKDGLKNSSAVLHPKETVILSRDAGVGKSAVMKTDMAVSQHFIVWKPIESKLNNWFLYYKLQILKPEFERIAIGNTIKTIGLPYFKKLSFLIPSVKEQTKIANFLSSIDEKINLLKEKKALLEEYKKGIMQKIFNQEIRFKGDNGEDFEEWEEKQIKDIFKVTRGTVLSMTMIKEDVQGDYIYPVYSSQTKQNGLAGFYKSYLFEDAITWTTDGAGAGDVKYRKGKFYCTNVCGVLLNMEGYSNLFIAEIINSVSRNYVSYVGNPKLMNNVMADIKICIPFSVKEQTKIANFLSAIDEKINLVATQIEDTQEYKKGLLQQMFV